jgi:hypothetical protein
VSKITSCTSVYLPSSRTSLYLLFEFVGRQEQDHLLAMPNIFRILIAPQDVFPQYDALAALAIMTSGDEGGFGGQAGPERLRGCGTHTSSRKLREC